MNPLSKSFTINGKSTSMVRISDLITGKINGKQELNLSTVKVQQLAVATAWQILKYYSSPQLSNEWNKYKYLRGVMLADEVGGGKTFEALSIISKLLLNSAKSGRNRFRVLIIAAPAIRSKWEWKDEDEPAQWCDLKRFLEQSDLTPKKKNILENYLQTSQGENIITNKRQWKYINNTRQGIWITSFGNLPATKNSKTNATFKKDKQIEFPKNYFDYIIADEAHIVKSGYKDSDESIETKLDGSAIRKIYAVLNDSMNAKLLLLTATPFQNNLSEFMHLISLLETPNYERYSIIKIIEAGLIALYNEIEKLKSAESIDEEQIKNLVNSFNNEVGDLISENEEELKRPKIISTHGRKNGLDDFLRDVIVRNNKKHLDIAPQECLLNDDEKLQYLLFRDIISSKQEDEKEMFSVKLSQLVSSEPAFANSLRKPIQSGKYSAIKKLFGGKHLVFEKKFDSLISLIENESILEDKNVIVVFCRFIPTIEILEKRLKKSLPGIKVIRMDGTTTKVKERKSLLNAIQQMNKESNAKIVFLVSQVGNEGLDFDEFSDTVIHFDWHYNPAVIDQRNGRVYRRGNLNREIKVSHIYIKGTYDERIKFIELEKRKMKNFFLGDSDLQEIIKKIFSIKEIDKEKEYLKEIEKIRFDFHPKKAYLLPAVKKLL